MTNATHTLTPAQREARYAAHFARADRMTQAGQRAARIMNRVLPLLTSHGAYYDVGAFVTASNRHGERAVLYAAIYPRLLAKIEAECPSLDMAVERRAAA